MHGYPKLGRTRSPMVAEFFGRVLRWGGAARSSVGMGFVVNRHELGDGDAGVSLRGGKRRVAEQFLNGTQIGSIREQVRGECVPERMRMQVPVVAEQSRIFLYDVGDHAPRQPASAQIEKHGACVAARFRPAQD